MLLIFALATALAATWEWKTQLSYSLKLLYQVTQPFNCLHLTRRRPQVTIQPTNDRFLIDFDESNSNQTNDSVIVESVTPKPTDTIQPMLLILKY